MIYSLYYNVKIFTQHNYQLTETLNHINVMSTVSDVISENLNSNPKSATNELDDFRQVTTSQGLSSYLSMVIKLN